MAYLSKQVMLKSMKRNIYLLLGFLKIIEGENFRLRNSRKPLARPVTVMATPTEGTVC
jgi:hypothetical protein